MKFFLTLLLLSLSASPSLGWIEAWKAYVDQETGRALAQLAQERPECARYPFFGHQVWRDLAESGEFDTMFSDQGRRFTVEFKTKSGGVFK